MSFLLVITHLPDTASAKALAEHLVEARLAGCINILPACQSVYRWQDKLEKSSEVPLLIKTAADRYPALEAAIVEHHPYDLPDIIALPIQAGLPAYLDWLQKEK